MASYPYLISRTLDPLFGVFIGVASFYAHEQRVGRKPGHSLNELVAKRFSSEKKQ
ncbi:hypothetical protein WICANDRAFT_59745 [Wickerhamomyces anomalus NRRL Y-366-8]|uniref:Non-classical export protein 1 n=1 Tax=Wickerhamomyces anomalus (strain ATCC 58044 / CBS 1984 / NCYC 433 / NRRL Y-366-8) TaxID=683960 RepID=A0A1E3P8C4_WICAA|nr:uncharacterized protein WICANDRAFT_59745 [Wickerhamomyces anomalus NRRL Y-366-8]ODQ61663.1 hypothetical protein WICANDRAFT_59745 [Wickerhamomyces anomalus NRRL Y-366-8]